MKTTNNRRRSQEPYAEVYVFDDTDEITLFEKRNYKAAVSIVLNLSRMRSVKCLFDTAAGPSLPREDMVKVDWKESSRVSKKSRLKNRMS